MMTPVSLKRQPTLPAHLQLGRDLNAKFKLNLPDDAVAAVTADVPCVTSASEFYPFTKPDLIADVQQAVIGNKSGAIVLSFPLHGENVGKYFAQGSANNAFLLVLVNEATGKVRTLSVPLVKAMHSQKAQAVAYFSSLREDVSQAAMYVAAVARAGYLSVAWAADALGTNFLPSQVHFRPVFSKENLPHLDGTLDDLVATGSKVGSLGKMMNASFVASGTLPELMGLAESFGRTKH